MTSYWFSELLSEKRMRVGKDVERLEPCALWWKRSGAAAVETVWRVLKSLTIELPSDPAIPHLGITPQNQKQGLEEIPVHSCVQSSSITHSSCNRSNLSMQRQVHRQTKCGMCLWRHIIHHLKRRRFCKTPQHKGKLLSARSPSQKD